MALDKYTVGRRYGKALFEIAEDKDNVEEMYQELLILRQVFKDNADLDAILTDTRLDLNAKKPILDGLKAKFSPVIQTFIQMVFDYKRMNDILFIIDHFESLYNEKNKVILATVTTAVDLTEAQSQKLSQEIAKRFDASKVQINNMIDPEIIGGVIVQTADKVVDGSIRTRLMTIKSLLLNR